VETDPREREMKPHWRGEALFLVENPVKRGSGTISILRPVNICLVWAIDRQENKENAHAFILSELRHS
jgi:hypothetical protein